MVKNKRLSEVSIPRNYQRRQCYLSTQKWLDSQGLVIAGYWDKVAGVNLLHLVALWREAQLDGEALDDAYPYAAEHFKIRVVKEGEKAYIQDILPEFEGCPHVKIWCMGFEMGLSPISKMRFTSKQTLIHGDYNDSMRHKSDLEQSWI